MFQKTSPSNLYLNFIISFLSAFGILFFSSLSSFSQKTHQLSLKESLDYGLNHHLSMQISKNNVLKSKELARESLAGYLPQVNVSGGFDNNLKLPQTIIPENTFGPGTPEQRISFGSQFNSTLTAQVDQKIYDQSLISGLKARQPNIDLAKMIAEQTRENVIYNIASAYFQILVAQKQLELLKENKKRFDKILEVTQLQVQQGVAKKVDIKQVQVNLNNINSQISVVENNVELAKNTLKNNMGINQNDSIYLIDSSRWLNQAPSIKPTPTFDYQSNTNFKIQSIQIDLLKIQRRMIHDQIYPSLSLYARYGANGYGNEMSRAFNPLLDFSTIGIKVIWSPFTGFRRDAQHKQAQLDISNALFNLKLNEDNQYLYFQNAKAQLKRSQITIISNKENMDLATEVYENTSLQYREGIASLSDLLNAELAFREAQNNYIQALLDYYLADLAIQKANGSLETYYNHL